MLYIQIADRLLMKRRVAKTYLESNTAVGRHALDQVMVDAPTDSVRGTGGRVGGGSEAPDTSGRRRDATQATSIGAGRTVGWHFVYSHGQGEAVGVRAAVTNNKTARLR